MFAWRSKAFSRLFRGLSDYLFLVSRNLIPEKPQALVCLSAKEILGPGTRKPTRMGDLPPQRLGLMRKSYRRSWYGASRIASSRASGSAVSAPASLAAPPSEFRTVAGIAGMCCLPLSPFLLKKGSWRDVPSFHHHMNEGFFLVFNTWLLNYNSSRCLCEFKP